MLRQAHGFPQFRGAKRRHRSTWALIADLPGHRERPHEADGVGEVAQAFAEVEGWGECAVGGGDAGIGRAAAAPIDDQSEQQRELVRSILEQLVLQCSLEIAKAAAALTVRLTEVGPGFSNGKAKILGDALGYVSTSVAGGTSAVLL